MTTERREDKGTGLALWHASGSRSRGTGPMVSRRHMFCVLIFQGKIRDISGSQNRAEVGCEIRGDDHYVFQADEMEKFLICEEIGCNVDNINDIFVKILEDMNIAAESIGRLAEFAQSLRRLAETEHGI